MLDVLADGVYALSAGGDPTVGAVEGDDFLVCFEARATPTMAARWLDRLREHTDKPVRYLVLSHYHAVRTLGAAAFERRGRRRPREHEGADRRAGQGGLGLRGRTHAALVPGGRDDPRPHVARR